MTRADAVETALDPIRAALDADGATMDVLECEDERLTVVLRLRPDACGECILPPDQLEVMVADAVREVRPGFESVRLKVE